MIGRLIRQATQLVQVVLLLAVVGLVSAAAYWLAHRGQGVVPPATEQGEVRVLAPVLPRRSVIVGARRDSSSVEGRTIVRLREVPVEDGHDVALTIAVEDSSGGASLLLGLKPRRAPLFYEFRGRRAVETTVVLLPGSRPARPVVVAQPSSLLELEVLPSLGVGVGDRLEVIGAVSALRVWGVHLGGYVGVELGSGDARWRLSMGSHVGVRVVPSVMLGLGYDVHGATGVRGALTVTW